MSAGTAGDTGSSRLWAAADGLFKSTDGNVSVVKPKADGTLEPTTWANKCLTPAGRAVSAGQTASTSGGRVQISDGAGVIRADGSGEIAWDGSFSIVFYGGLTYWSISDPVLTWDANGTNRQLTGTASGFGTSMEDMTQWVPIAPEEIVLANLANLQVGANTIAGTPAYAGVEITTASTLQTRTGANWGAFPQSFVDFNQKTGQSSYWYSSGGARDAAKPANGFSVSFTATDDGGTTEPEVGAGDIIVEVPEAPEVPETGAFGWAWANETAVDLGTAAVDGNNFRAEGALTPVVVTDTRAGGNGSFSWSISGAVSDFTSGANSFGGSNLGWTPSVVSGGAVQGPTTQSSTLGGAGLGAETELARGLNVSSATLGATLSLVIPGTTPATSTPNAAHACPQAKI